MGPSRTNSSANSSVFTIRRPQPSLISSSPSAFASSTALAGFTSRHCTPNSAFFARAASPTRVGAYDNHRRHQQHNRSHNQSSPSVSFSVDRPTSPGHSISIRRQTSGDANAVTNHKRACLCSPTTHPGSFRCAFHRTLMKNGNHSNGCGASSSSYPSSSALNLRRSAMKNSLVRIGGVEGELVKRALSTLIRPSSHHLRRRADFHPKPSRLSIMCKADDS